MSTKFPHLKHQDMLGKDKSCIICHHMSLPDDKSTSCSRCHRKMFNKTLIFKHEMHIVLVARKRKISGLYPGNKTCIICHPPGLPKSADKSAACMECHKEDMNAADTLNLHKHFLYAGSYLGAMHKLCIGCHKKKKEQVNKPYLDRCSNCHKNYYRGNGAEKLLTLSRNNHTLSR